MVKRMVVGFAFTENRKGVVLIRKNRPAWQAGRLNGVGGHIEQSEHPRDAMSREFEEETGIHVRGGRWERVVMLEGAGWHVTFFRCVLTTHDLHFMKSMTDEEVVVVGCEQPTDLIENLTWLIPLCLDMSGVQVPIGLRDVGAN